MNPAIRQTVGILATVLAALCIYAYTDFSASLSGIPLKKTALRDYMVADAESTAATATWLKGRPAPKTPPGAPPPSEQPDTAAQRILLFGDSMMEQLMFRMKDYAEANGHQLQPVVWYGSSTKLWGSCDTLAHFIKLYKPTYIICCLGGNELFIRNVVKERAPFVQHILQQIGNRKYLWLGPPNWKKDTGINDLIKQEVGKGCFYPSMNLNLARRHDGAHPTPKAAAQWMDSVATWMRTPACKYRIRMATPAAKAKHTPNAVLLRMAS